MTGNRGPRRGSHVHGKRPRVVVGSVVPGAAIAVLADAPVGLFPLTLAGRAGIRVPARSMRHAAPGAYVVIVLLTHGFKKRSGGKRVAPG